MKKSPPPGGYFDLDGRRVEIKKLETEMSQPDFWQDQKRAQTVSKNVEHQKKLVAEWDALATAVATVLDLARESGEVPEMLRDLEDELLKLKKQYARMEVTALFDGPHDEADAIVSIHAGAGGVEAQDWVSMLLRMIMKFGEKRGYEVSIIDQSEGQEAGYKSVSLEVRGMYAYGNLKSEAGVHRLVRISPFDAEKMRHTSFALMEILPVLAETDIEIKQEDLRIDVFRSGGKGGQSVNTTDSAVRITHLPSGIVVKCQNERSQIQNRQTAMKILQARLAQLAEKARGKELAEIRGELMAAEWGSQIRSYVLQPYKLVKDHRTDFESTEPDDVLAGNLDGFVESYLRYLKSGKGEVGSGK